MPQVKVVAFQDDTYLLAAPQDLDTLITLVRQLWAELGLSVNGSKLKLWAATEETRQGLSPEWHALLVPSLKMLGQKLSLRLTEEGIVFELTDDANLAKDGLRKAYAQLAALGIRLRVVVRHGLPLAVAHCIWVYASSGAITHLLSTQYSEPAGMDEFV